MAAHITEALEKLQLHEKAGEDYDAWLDDIEDDRPRKRTKQSAESLKKSLENDFLSPSTTFDTEWLNQLQQ